MRAAAEIIRDVDASGLSLQNIRIPLAARDGDPHPIGKGPHLLRCERCQEGLALFFKLSPFAARLVADVDIEIHGIG